MLRSAGYSPSSSLSLFFVPFYHSVVAYTTVLRTEVGTISLDAKTSVPRSRIITHPERLPRRYLILIPTLGVSTPKAPISDPEKTSKGLLSRGSLPKPGIGLILALSRTYDADLRTEYMLA